MYPKIFNKSTYSKQMRFAHTRDQIIFRFSVKIINSHSTKRRYGRFKCLIISKPWLPPLMANPKSKEHGVPSMIKLSELSLRME